MTLKLRIFAAAQFLSLISVAHADQWPGQRDFDSLNGPTSNKSRDGSVPVYDYRFDARTPGSWWIAPGSNSRLPPAQYNQCLQERYAMPTRDINCGGR